MPESPADALRIDTSVPVSALPGFADGEVSVQDASAQLVADALSPAAGARVLDACAAPGGKSAHLLERDPSLRLTALDVDAARLDKVRATFIRLALGRNARLWAADAGDLGAWWDGTPYDAILLDAPCSATGIVRRQPDVLLHRRETDLAALLATQARLLDALWRTLAPGGVLLYATCSILHDENAHQVDAFLARTPDASGRAARCTLRPGQRRGPAAVARRGRHGRILLCPAAQARVTTAALSCATDERPMTHASDQRRELFWFLAIAFVILAAGIGLRDPWPADEPRFVLVARQMWDSGDWLFPHRGQELYPDKPPLYFWLLGVGLRPGARLDLGVPAAVVAGRDGHAVADVRPRPAAVVASRRAVGGDRGAGVGAVHLPGQARADRSDRGVLHHPRRVRHRAARVAGPELALVLAGLLRRRTWRDQQGRRLPRAAGVAAVCGDALATLARAGGTGRRGMPGIGRPARSPSSARSRCGSCRCWCRH